MRLLEVKGIHRVRLVTPSLALLLKMEAAQMLNPVVAEE